ncbi:Por secretion system C-terminal sorting domain-containing protein [Flavobacterium fryxellicola]|uniref:Endonuclease I n=1 Tax=Flavobacterium fryxellicola TaxID=249352 RepID=A0A162P781_9FLAO|nr:endonuclease [Flavobacterium fryxellicola]OAB29100.1 endonuclease I [Flavobacterium fryxellicola]SHN58439.1 Por secretion system C-terminal sorting domain-containing protein [Flavobacterium fryxellicola]
MKKIYSILLLPVVTAAIAQIPSGYYATSTGTGYTLKTQLYNIIKGHTDPGYAGLYTTYQTSDRDYYYENDGTILDMYSEKPAGTDPYSYTAGTTQRCGTYSVEGDCYNREHIIPQSTFNSAAPMVSDAHFITPTDGKVNGQRSNYPHGPVTSPTWTSLNGSKLGASTLSGYTGPIFEPINEFKGDIARMYFYFATRYENTVAGYSYAMFNNSSNQVFTTAFLNLLITWHNQDPVSAREIARNNAIFAIQKNRNPYIDHPEYVQAIWNPTADSQAPTAPANLVSTAKTTNSISLSWSGSIDNTAVTGYNLYQNSVLKTTTTGLTTTITGLTASTAYSFSVKAKDAAGNLSLASNTLNVTTSSSSTATDLLFSEYIEGSSNNKALEISNATGASINLSVYSIKKQTNGAGSWSTGLALTGTLNNLSKFTIVNSLMASSCYPISSANLSTSAGEMAFNGNDAVGLFKNGILIDIIGTFNGGTANFAADATIRRKITITAPSTTFNKAVQWDSFASDTCTNLGSRIVVKEPKAATDVAINAIAIYPNPSNGTFFVNNANRMYSIAVYSLIGQKIYAEENCTNSEIRVPNIAKGTYLVRVSMDSDSVIKKLIIN